MGEINEVFHAVSQKARTRKDPFKHSIIIIISLWALFFNNNKRTKHFFIIFPSFWYFQLLDSVFVVKNAQFSNRYATYCENSNNNNNTIICSKTTKTMTTTQKWKRWKRHAIEMQAFPLLMKQKCQLFSLNIRKLFRIGVIPFWISRKHNNDNEKKKLKEWQWMWEW